MSWRGNLRTGLAIARRIDRENKRNIRQGEKAYKDALKTKEIELASSSVSEFENYINRITTLHHEVNEKIDWNSILSEEKPIEPSISNKLTSQAQKELENFRPTFLGKFFNGNEKNLKKLKQRVSEISNKEEINFKSEKAKYNQDLEKWNLFQDIAKGVLKKDENSYVEAFKQLDPYTNYSDIGIRLSIDFQPKYAEIDVFVHDYSIIPENTLSQYANGKLSSKKMSNTQRHSYYQSHICSVVLSSAREMFAMLPLERVFVNAITDSISSKTGLFEENTILSVLFPDKTFSKINFSKTDPIRCLDNFLHNISFNSTNGFKAINKLNPKDFQ